MTATEQLEQLDRRYAEAVEARCRADVDEREAHHHVRAVSAEVEDLLAQKMQGDEPPGRTLTDARQRLDKVREATRREWALERKARDRVVRDTDGARQRFIGEHAEELLAEEYEIGDALAEEMNEAARRVVELRAQLAAADQRVVRVIHNTHRGEERRVCQPRADALVREVQ